MIDTDIGWDIVKVGETELSDDELKMIMHALRARSEHWSNLAEDDDYLNRRADRQIRINKAHYDSQYENDPEGRDELHEFLKGEIKRDCRSESKELQRLGNLFFDVYQERKEMIE
tara:strand:- start:2247 stop:2591 length:345 start_codon:yes stop_codon:yes gene_type:complete